MLIANDAWAREECLLGEGYLKCSHDPDKAQNIAIQLMDKDRLDSDDKMGIGISDEKGKFVIQGCASDFGPWNSPDPYLVIYHTCNRPEGEIFRMDLERKFFPKHLEIGEIWLNSVEENIA